MLSCKFSSSGPISLNSILLTKVIVHPALESVDVPSRRLSNLVSLSLELLKFTSFSILSAISTEKIDERRRFPSSTSLG